MQKLIEIKEKFVLHNYQSFPNVISWKKDFRQYFFHRKFFKMRALHRIV